MKERKNVEYDMNEMKHMQSVCVVLFSLSILLSIALLVALWFGW